MLLIFLDTEMNGLDPFKHRAVEIAFKIVDHLTFQTLFTYHSLIVQSQEVWANSDPRSLEVNRLSYEDILKGKPEKVVESEITLAFNRANIAQETGCFICQNPSLDRVFFSQIISRDLQSQYKWPYHWLDLASMYWAFRHLLSPEKPNLKEKDLRKDFIATYLHLPPEEFPHRALNGVNHLMACYQKMFLESLKISFPGN